MADTSRQNKKMPDGVMKKKSFPGVKNQAKAVKQTTCKKKFQPRPRYQFNGWLNGKDNHPAHKEITQLSQTRKVSNMLK
jgi:hypothetical protein